MTIDISSIDRIVEMAWEDRTPFQAIGVNYPNLGYTPSA